MTHENAFLQAILESPDDDGLRPVYADWLEENGQPGRAELLRLHCRLVASCCEPDRHPERAGCQARLVELLGQGVRPAVPQRMVAVGNGVEMRFAWVPPGAFLMGSLPGEPERSAAETQHRVTLTKGYWLGIHQVTQAQWLAVMGSNPSRFQGDDRPVEQVSWVDCQQFLLKLGQKTGAQFRLPTKAEWEYACRAGMTTPFHFGDTISTDQANYNGDYAYGTGKKGVNRKQTTPVGCFPPNAWGLYDMHGNVWEWCQDWYPYPKIDIKDPQEPDSGTARVLRGGSWYSRQPDSGTARVLRGGSWYSRPGFCRSADRYGFAPAYRFNFVGCRVLLCLD